MARQPSDPGILDEVPGFFSFQCQLQFGEAYPRSIVPLTIPNQILQSHYSLPKEGVPNLPGGNPKSDQSHHNKKELGQGDGFLPVIPSFGWVGRGYLWISAQAV
jgi:hypothetical protein